ncbi:unnamed protein product [Peronospora destructor]|uniref:Adhesin domain-containing protein n=1 Tax=Peronospora destructor TaxID=86335 RepID=A0AAV0UI16_9STRA|nr:unnamed protein product [Peronospora destructor]
MLLGRRVVALRSRCLSVSTSSLSLSHRLHQSRVQFQAANVARADVEIVPVLNVSDFAMRVSNGVDVHDAFSIDMEDKKTLRIAKKSGGDTKVQLFLPQTIDLHVAVANGSVVVQDKIEGDVKVVVGCGDISVHKLRGQMVNLKTNGGTIQVSALAEGETVHLEASDSIQCKKLMAGKAQVKLGKEGQRNSEFGAIYASTCSITSTDQSGETELRVGNMHGYLRVASEGLKSVQVDSVTGALEMQDSGDNCHVVAHFDSWTDNSSSSILVGGDVRVSLQPAAPIDVELHGTKVTLGTECKFLSSEMDHLDDDYAVFTGELQAQEGTLASSSTGKINMESAKEDAMRTSFFMKQSSSDEEGEESKTSRLFVHALSGEVTMDQLNWMDNIKRKHLKR